MGLFLIERTKVYAQNPPNTHVLACELACRDCIRIKAIVWSRVSVHLLVYCIS